VTSFRGFDSYCCSYYVATFLPAIVLPVPPAMAICPVHCGSIVGFDLCASHRYVPTLTADSLNLALSVTGSCSCSCSCFPICCEMIAASHQVLMERILPMIHYRATHPCLFGCCCSSGPDKVLELETKPRLGGSETSPDAACRPFGHPSRQVPTKPRQTNGNVSRLWATPAALIEQRTAVVSCD
jgi:hypothetical protein